MRAFVQKHYHTILKVNTAVFIISLFAALATSVGDNKITALITANAVPSGATGTFFPASIFVFILNLLCVVVVMGLYAPQLVTNKKSYETPAELVKEFVLSTVKSHSVMSSKEYAQYLFKVLQAKHADANHYLDLISVTTINGALAVVVDEKANLMSDEELVSTLGTMMQFFGSSNKDDDPFKTVLKQHLQPEVREALLKRGFSI